MQKLIATDSVIELMRRMRQSEHKQATASSNGTGEEGQREGGEEIGGREGVKSNINKTTISNFLLSKL